MRCDVPRAHFLEDRSRSYKKQNALREFSSEARTLRLVISEVLGIMTVRNARERHVQFTEFTCSVYVPSAFSDAAGSATSSTIVLSKPIPARATEAARFAFFGNCLAASRAFPEKTTDGWMSK